MTSGRPTSKAFVLRLSRRLQRKYCLSAEAALVGSRELVHRPGYRSPQYRTHITTATEFPTATIRPFPNLLSASWHSLLADFQAPNYSMSRHA